MIFGCPVSLGDPGGLAFTLTLLNVYKPRWSPSGITDNILCVYGCVMCLFQVLPTLYIECAGHAAVSCWSCHYS